MLGGLGWNLLHVWAGDWIQQPDTMREALLRRVEKLATGASGEGCDGVSGDAAGVRERPASSPPQTASSASRDPDVSRLPAGVVACERFRGPGRGDRMALLGSRPEDLGKLFAEIALVEGSIPREELFRVVAGLHSTRVVGEVKTALQSAPRPPGPRACSPVAGTSSGPPVWSALRFAGVSVMAR